MCGSSFFVPLRTMVFELLWYRKWRRDKGLFSGRTNKGLFGRGLDQRSLVLLLLLGARVISAQIRSKSRTQRSLDSRFSDPYLVNVDYRWSCRIRSSISFFNFSICDFAFFGREHNLFTGFRETMNLFPAKLVAYGALFNTSAGAGSDKQ